MTVSDEKIVGEIERLSSQLAAHPDASLYGPAQFWDSHCKKHADLIRRHGFDSFKRTINFEYGQWGVRSLRDPKILNLIFQLLRRGRLPTAPLWTRVDLSQADKIRWADPIDPASGQIVGSPAKTLGRPKMYLSLYGLYVGLLWQYALLDDHLKCLSREKEPPLGQPMPVTYKGQPISQDLAISSMELNRIAQFAPLKPGTRIAEIGAGYGRLAHVVLRMFPDVRYRIFDIPPALLIARYYLGALLGDDQLQSHYDAQSSSANNGPLVLSLSHQLADEPDRSFDVMINISSFDEMSPEQVRHYFSLIEKKGRGILYLKGYAKTRSAGRRLGVEDFPFRPHWKLLAERRDPIVPLFTERIYQLA